MLEPLNQARPYAISLFRFVIGFLLACHGASSIFGILGGHMGSGSATPAGTWPTWYAALIQLICGTLVALGLGTRAAAFVASGAMAYAYFSVHQSQSFLPLQNGGEAAAFFSWAFLLLVFTGPGAVALDRLFSARAESARREEHPRNHAAVTL
ncbi:DoxX family protein [Streptomyces sp. NBC_00654]|uniref:DoxX family protein n=1 Tax=Streptomyces sp. NBC_00654 TaxID=2975799 RepID=UPI002257A223|nr:DoxX family protein [Streptomyces sp. NBC_00654]MCX4969063.1 DoxX family protein [Streptomyces sp. NBC_00654]